LIGKETEVVFIDKMHYNSDSIRDARFIPERNTELEEYRHEQHLPDFPAVILLMISFPVSQISIKDDWRCTQKIY